ncbi:MAG: glycosyltransferase family 4 protein [Vicinamibacteraceae bacterium]
MRTGRGGVDSPPSGSFRLIGLFDAYLSTLGGGENFLAVLAEFFEEEFPSAKIDIVTYQENSVPIQAVVERFGVRLGRTQVRTLTPNARGHLSKIRPVQRLMHEQDVARLSAEYDLFVNITIFSLAPSRAPASIYICMFPLDPRPWWLPRDGLRVPLLAPYTALRRRLYKKWIGSYTLVVAISEFTRTWIRRFWDLEAEILYPPVGTRPEIDLSRKRQSILCVGRFFPGNHNKRHDVLIDTFARLVREGLTGWELHLVGGRTQVPGTDEYIDVLTQQAEGLPVTFHIDASSDELAGLLESCSIFWHATGYGEDESQEPYKLEHFGISTVEAMSHGCVPVVYACGGQPEIIEHGRSGFLWTSLDEFRDHTLRLIEDRDLREASAKHAGERSQRFNRESFRSSFRELISRHLRAPTTS